MAKLQEQGFLIIFSPNGSDDLQQGSNHTFHSLWGQVHPNMMSSSFYQSVFAKYPHYIASLPYDFDEIASWDQNKQIVRLNGGDELLCIVKKTSV